MKIKKIEEQEFNDCQDLVKNEQIYKHMKKRDYVVQHKSWTRITTFFGILLIYALIHSVMELSWYIMVTQNHKLEMPSEGIGTIKEKDNLWIKQTMEKVKQKVSENIKMTKKTESEVPKTKKPNKIKSGKKRRSFTGGKIDKSKFK